MMSRQLKCNHIGLELCSFAQRSDTQADCLRNICSDHQQRCDALHKMENGCGMQKSGTVTELCG